MAGRPRKQVDLDLLEKLAAKQWSDREIAATLNVSVDTLHRHFAEHIEKGRQSGQAKLRDLQWKRALEGSDRVLLHMSAHYLGQNQKLELAVEKIPDEILIQEAQRRLNEKNNKP